MKTEQDIKMGHYFMIAEHRVTSRITGKEHQVRSRNHTILNATSRTILAGMTKKRLVPALLHAQ